MSNPPDTCRHPGCQFRIIRVMTTSEYCYRHRKLHEEGGAPAAAAPPPPEPAVVEQRRIELPVRRLQQSSSFGVDTRTDQRRMHALLGEEGRALFAAAACVSLDEAAFANLNVNFDSTQRPTVSAGVVSRGEQKLDEADEESSSDEDEYVTSADEDEGQGSQDDTQATGTVSRPKMSATDIMYAEILESLMDNPAKRAHLMRTEPEAKKKQLIEMYNDYVSTAWITTIVHDAVGLAKADRFGLSDPYCEVWFRLDKQSPWELKGTTEVNMNTLTPVWTQNNRFRWSCPARVAPQAQIRIDVWDYNRIGRPDFLGRANIKREFRRLGSGAGDRHRVEKQYIDLAQRSERDSYVQGALGVTVAVRTRQT